MKRNNNPIYFRYHDEKVHRANKQVRRSGLSFETLQNESSPLVSPKLGKKHLNPPEATEEKPKSRKHLSPKPAEHVKEFQSKKHVSETHVQNRFQGDGYMDRKRHIDFSKGEECKFKPSKTIVNKEGMKSTAFTAPDASIGHSEPQLTSLPLQSSLRGSKTVPHLRINTISSKKRVDEPKEQLPSTRGRRTFESQYSFNRNFFTDDGTPTSARRNIEQNNPTYRRTNNFLVDDTPPPMNSGRKHLSGPSVSDATSHSGIVPVPVSGFFGGLRR